MAQETEAAEAVARCVKCDAPVWVVGKVVVCLIGVEEGASVLEVPQEEWGCGDDDPSELRLACMRCGDECGWHLEGSVPVRDVGA